VATILAGIEAAAQGTIARLRTKDQWVADSTLSSGLFKKKAKRPEGLEKIDAAVATYEAFGDLDALMQARSYDDGKDLVARKVLDDRASAISNIKDAIGGWKRPRKPGAKGWAEVEALETEAEAERKKISDVVGRWEAAARAARAEARGQKMDPLIPKDLDTKKSAQEKAQQLFTIFMRFRGTVGYQTSSRSEFWDGGGDRMACATFANGFRDFLRRAGIKAETVAIGPKNFIRCRSATPSSTRRATATSPSPARTGRRRGASSSASTTSCR
jgi:hypothetical protein